MGRQKGGGEADRQPAALLRQRIFEKHAATRKKLFEAGTRAQANTSEVNNSQSVGQTHTCSRPSASPAALHVRMASTLVGTIGSSITALRTDEKSIIIGGLCSRLRVWSRTAVVRALIEASHGASIAAVRLVPRVQWDLSLDVNLPTGPIRCISRCSQDHRFAVCGVDGPILIFCARSWKQLQVLQPALHMYGARWSPSSIDLGGSHLACGSREGLVQLWRSEGAPAAQFVRQWRGGGRRGDAGPVSAVIVDGSRQVIVAAYQYVAGSVDGVHFPGEAA